MGGSSGAFGVVSILGSFTALGESTKTDESSPAELACQNDENGQQEGGDAKYVGVPGSKQPSPRAIRAGLD